MTGSTEPPSRPGPETGRGARARAPTGGGLVLRNASWNSAGYVWLGLVLFLLIPYVVGRIGPTAYGVWTVVLVLTGYSTLLDFGLGAALVRFVADAVAAGDRPRLHRVIGGGLAFYLGFAAVVLAVALPLRGALVGLLNIPPEMRDVARTALGFAYATFALNMILAVALSVLAGLQRMDASNLIRIGATIPRVVLFVAVLESGRGLLGLMAADLAVAALAVAGSAVAVRRLIPDLPVLPRLPDRALFGRMFRFGIQVQVSSISELVNFHLDKLLLARFVGVREAGFYEVGGYLIARLRGFLVQVPSAVTPAVAERHARGERESIERLHRGASKWVAALATLGFGAAALTAPSLFRFWMGPGFETSARTMQILAAGYWMNVVTAVTAYTTQGIGRPEVQMRAAVVQIVANVVASPALILSIGYFGGPIGTAGALVLGGIYFLVAFARLFREDPAFLGRLAAKPIISLIAGGAAALAVRALIRAAAGVPDAGAGAGQAAADAVSRGSAFLMWLAEAAAIAIVYVAVLRALGYLERDEIAPVAERVRAVWPSRGTRQASGA